MKKTAVSVISLLLALALCAPAWAAGTQTDAAAYIVAAVPEPGVGAVGGEWAVFGLARSGADVPDGYFEKYLAAAQAYVAGCGGVLSERKYTEYARVTIALTALGCDARSFAGYDLTAPLADTAAVLRQGATGAAFALIALDCGGYGTPELQGAYTDALLSLELPGGGFSLGGEPDADVTAIVLTALAGHRDRAAETVARGLAALSSLQEEDGGFSSGGVPCCESTAQAVVALSALGIAPDDARFVKNGRTALDALADYASPDGGFRHKKDAAASDLMATEQALYALAAAALAGAGERSLYDMRALLPAFSDIASSPYREEIEKMAAAGVVNGVGGGLFMPDAHLTRAQFCAMTVRAAGLEPSVTDAFSDVPEQAWYAPWIGAAYAAGIIRGVGGGLFAPEGTITVREAEIMLARASRLFGGQGEEPAWYAGGALITRAQTAHELCLLMEAVA